MNDFTKEELEDLRNGVRLLLEQDHCDGGYTREIRALEDKLQSMIDSYCEHDCNHESDGYDYFKIGEDELLMDVLKTRKHQLICVKCQRIYDDNQ